jgi:hypothetical protein
MERINVATLRYRLFQNAGLVSFAQGPPEQKAF